MITFTRFDLTNLPINTATWCIFARASMWASIQMSPIVETHTRVCQNTSFLNTQDIVNILSGSLLENERNEDPVILRDASQFSSECLTDDECESHTLFTQSATLVQVRLMPSVLGKSDSCKNRNDIASQSIEIEWHVCPGRHFWANKYFESSVGKPSTNLGTFRTGSFPRACPTTSLAGKPESAS